MLIELAVAGGFMAAKYAYHRWLEVKPRPPEEKRTFEVPKIEEGTVYPLFYGKVRLRKMILAWAAPPEFTDGVWQMDQLYLLGIPCQDGDGDTKVHGMWQGERKFVWNEIVAGPAPGFAQPLISTGPIGLNLGGTAQYMPGSPTQKFVDEFVVAQNLVAQRMLDTGAIATHASGYRLYLTLGLTTSTVGAQWVIGADTSVPAYSVEASTYPTSASYPSVGLYHVISDGGMNPVDVMYDLYTGKEGKMGEDPAGIDDASWQAAAKTCRDEGLGYSMEIDNPKEADDHLIEILKYIDGAIDIDPASKKAVLTLVRGDYDINTIPHITKHNCFAIKNFKMTGWEIAPNVVRAGYRSREKGYTTDSEVEFNRGNTAGGIEEHYVDFPMCTVKEVAKNIAKREVGFRSRPIITCTAVVDRSFLRVLRGQPIKVTWSKPDIAGLVFRVANADRGNTEDESIELELILDAFFVWRSLPPKPPFEPDIPDWVLDF